MGLFDRFRKKTPKTDSSGNEQAVRHCFVLCPSIEPNGLAQAKTIVAEILGADYAAELEDNNIVTITRGNDTVGFLAHVPAPIPNSEAEENADGNFLWPNGREMTATHRSHVIVTNFGSSQQTPIQAAISLSRLSLVALRLFDGIAVYWGNASVTNSRAVFEEFCEGMSEEHLPIPVWLRYQLVRASDDGIGMYTLGMGQFNLMDIEVDRCKMSVSDLFEFVSNIAHYLIQSGPVIADGNTVGGSAEERILVRHRSSMIDEKKRVYKIVFEGN